MKLIALTGRLPAITYYRQAAPLAALARRYPDVEYYQPHPQDDRISLDLRLLADTDLVLSCQLAGEGILQMETALRTLGVPFLMDIDDNMFKVRPVNPMYGEFGRDRRVVEAYRRAGRVEDTEHSNKQRLAWLAECLRGATGVTVTTEALAEVYRPYNERVYVLPNQMEQRDWETVRAVDKEGIWLGFTGSAAHVEDLKMISRQVQQILDRYPEVTLVIIGSKVIDEWLPGLGLKPERVLTMPFMELSEYRKYIASFDIVLAPLEDHQFNRGKSDIRVLEANICGRPVVASPTVYAQAIENGGGGLIAKTPGDWVRHISTLLDMGTAVRSQVGGIGRAYVLKYRTYDANIEAWRQLYDEVILGAKP